MIGFIFCHGWSYAPPFWDALKLFFQNYPTVMWNLGYYQESTSLLCPQEKEAIVWVGVGHSLGFVTLLESGFAFDALIGLQAFTSFLGHDDALRNRRTKEYLFFKDQFQASPLGHVQDYQHFSETTLPENYYPFLREERLLNDLKALQTDYTPLLEAFQKPTLMLGSRGDMVVPPILLEDNFAHQPSVQLTFHPSKGHALGYYHAAWVAEQIQAFLAPLFQAKNTEEPKTNPQRDKNPFRQI
jgi:pimeloyl-[acyl-carrier protein] methyl ester esterase